MQPGEVLGKYRLDALIGRGGGGDVFLAVQRGLGGFSRPVAVKILHGADEITGQSVEKLAREARIIGRLQHRNIVQVHEVTEERGVYFLVMEYVDGVTLKSMIKGLAERVPFWLGIHIGVEVCRALQYAHQAEDEAGRPLGIIHRDIKPSNVLMSTQGDIKLSDFGLAKASLLKGDHLTAHGVIKGTPAYMSPEQRAGMAATPSSDVFSLAMMIFEACTGRRPEVGRRARLPAPLAEMNPAVPRELDQQLRRALDHKPAKRPTAAVLSGVLERTLGVITPAELLSRLGAETGLWVRRVIKGLRGVPSSHVTQPALQSPDSRQRSPGDQPQGAVRGSFAGKIEHDEEATSPSPRAAVVVQGAAELADRSTWIAREKQEAPAARPRRTTGPPSPADPKIPDGLPVLEVQHIAAIAAEPQEEDVPTTQVDAGLPEGPDLEYAERAQRTHRRIFGLVLFALLVMLAVALWHEGMLGWLRDRALGHVDAGAPSAEPAAPDAGRSSFTRDDAGIP